MVDCVETGWGSGWGPVPWGGGAPTDLQLVGAQAVCENVVRLQFNNPPLFSRQLDLHDASNRKRYLVRAVEGSVGDDGLPCRPVLPATAEPVVEAGAGGLLVDLTVDRPFSPYPARYVVSTNNLVTVAGYPMNVCFAQAPFLGLLQGSTPVSPDAAVGGRDFARPDTLSAMLDPLPSAGDPLVLGTLPTDASGDYAFDEGMTNLKKRIYRRLLTTKGRFAHLPLYGVGAGSYIKMLGRSGTRQALAADAQSQISQEPDVVKCAVRLVYAADPSIGRFVVLVRTTGGGVFRFDVPFSAV